MKGFMASVARSLGRGGEPSRETLGDVRRRAWATRRAKYGQQGHGSSYTRWQVEPTGRRALALVIRLHHEEVLSEGQCCTALGLDRITFRTVCDEFTP